MKPDSSNFDALAAALPPLHFDPDQDGFAADSLARAYFDFYGIDFSRQFPEAHHGIGVVDAAGFRVAAHYWLPPKPVATLVIVHGYYDHVGIYGRAIEFGLKHNFAVLAYDLPGHGLSSGPRVEIDSFQQYAEVLNTLLDQSESLLPGPRYAMGQSTGGTTLLIYLWLYSAGRFDKVALLAPLLLPTGWAVGRVAHRLLGRWLRSIPRAFPGSSHDAEFNRFQSQEDPLQARIVAVNWVSAMKAWDAHFRTLPPLDAPVLIVQGTGDQTVHWRYNLKQLQARLPNARVEIIENAKHHLVNESDPYREQVFAILADYFTAGGD